MNKLFLGLSLIFVSAIALSGNDVWQTLFKQKLLEATQGNSDAQLDVGSMYQKGRGVTADRALAIEWYEKSAAQNNQKASAKLSLMKANQTRFTRELKRAEKGEKDSQYNVGNMYKKGKGINIDTQEAIKWYENSANQGHIKAGFKLGQIFYEGTGVKKNRDTAFKWFKSSAEGNYPPAQYYLGKMYASGLGVKQSYSTALQWYSKAVDGGFNQARGEMIDVSERMEMQEYTKARADEKVAKKKAEAAAKEKQLARKKAEAAAKKKEIAKKKAEAAAKKKEIAKKKAEAAAREKQLAKKKAEAAAREKQLAKKKAEAAAAARKKQTARMESEAATRKKEIARMESEAAARKKEIAKMESEAATRKKLAAKKKAEAAARGKQLAKKKAAAAARKKQLAKKKKGSKSKFAVEDLMLATWSRDKKPVSYLPSIINTCRTENSKIVCYSDDQTRKSIVGDVRFKTKSIIAKFSSAGAFTVAYRNLVISSTSTAIDTDETDDDDIGGVEQAAKGYNIKSGWGKSHKLECQMKDSNTVSCLKDKTHAFLLISPQTVASGQ